MPISCPCLPNRRSRRTAPITDAEDKKGDRVEFAEKSRPLEEDDEGDTEATADVGLDNLPPIDINEWISEFKEKNSLAFLSHILPPATYTDSPKDPPSEDLQLDHVYGFSTTHRSTLLYLTSPHPPSPSSPPPSPPTLHTAGSAIIISHPSSSSDQFFSSHKRHVTHICAYPDKANAEGVVASAEVGPAPLVYVWKVGKTTGDVEVLIRLELPEEVESVAGLAFSRDGGLLVVAGNEEDDGSSVFVFEWRTQNTPIARAKVSEDKLYSLITSPHIRKDFITVGASHIKFWSIESPRLGGPGMILLPSDPDAVQTNLSPNPPERSTARGSVARRGTTKFVSNVVLPTFLCATFTKTKGQVVVGTAGGSVWFWKGKGVESICRKIHKVRGFL
ncbi:Echinoderm microtubule-associated protein-like 5 [Rhizophlyctis rosea]|uniref:Echinoderm microtubule-associated protein-like 5 n=1 Tax=Rhizophlyctis rosea TaxID=64517 RepID=A0AAD5SFR8_9FUNG|nr:Echinoderm microtubule-associated protein-like 5 [Rhizophlyctis rosea]